LVIVLEMHNRSSFYLFLIIFFNFSEIKERPTIKSASYIHI